MERRGGRFNRGALIGVPVLLLVLAGITLQGRLPGIPAWAFVAGGLALAALVATVVLRSSSSRDSALAGVASELGFDFSADGDATALSPLLNAERFEADNAAFDAEMIRELGAPPPEVMKMLAPQLEKALAHRGLERTELRHLSLFGGDVDHRRARNVMARAVPGGHLLVFDYTYQTRRIAEPENTFPVTQTVAAFRFPGSTLPAFELSPRGVVQRIASAMGKGDVGFASHTGFSRRFLLRADDEGAVRLLFQPAILESLERLDPAFDRTVEGAGECVVVYTAGQEVDASEMRAFVRDATVAASLFAGSPKEGSA